MPSKIGLTPGESEFSWGRGMMAPVERGYEPEQWDQLVGHRRTDSTDAGSEVDYRALGNPDRFGPGLPQVRETAPSMPSEVDVTRPGGVPAAEFKTGVTRSA